MIFLTMHSSAAQSEVITRPSRRQRDPGQRLTISYVRDNYWPGISDGYWRATIKLFDANAAWPFQQRTPFLRLFAFVCPKSLIEVASPSRSRDRLVEATPIRSSSIPFSGVVASVCRSIRIGALLELLFRTWGV